MADNAAQVSGVTFTPMMRQVGMLLGIAASMALGAYVILWSRTPSYTALYGELPDRDLSAVVQVLETANIPYQANYMTGAIMVGSGKLNEARMQLAAAELPSGGYSGFELLDKDQKIGTSQFLERVRYQRAIEGELARSITRLNLVKNARVHLALPKRSPFIRSAKGASASVLLELYSGRRLVTEQVMAIARMVATSVPELNESAVTIVDQRGNLLTQGKAFNVIAKSAERLGYQHEIEAFLSMRIEQILLPMMGDGGIRAQVAAEVDFTEIEKTSEQFNPDLPAVRSKQLLEEQRSGTLGGGIPGALSNTPPGTAVAPEIATGIPSGTAASTAAEPGNSRRQEIHNYELDKTISHTKLASGGIRRLSVAVLVKKTESKDKEGNVLETLPTNQQLAQIDSLVKEVIGFNSARGDTVKIIASDFAPEPELSPLPEEAMWEKSWFWDILRQVGAGIFILFLVFGVLRPVLSNLMRRTVTVTPELLSGPAGATGVAAVGPDGTPVPLSAADEAARRVGVGAGIPLGEVTGLVEQDPRLAAQVVKSWISEG